MPLKQSILGVYRRLPRPLAIALSRRKPSLAYYLRPLDHPVLIEGYLGEFRVEADTRSDIERRMLALTYEPGTIAVINRFVRPGSTCVDIGANVGAISLALAKAAGPGGRVHSVEPGPRTFQRLQRNIELNPSLRGRVFVHQLGLSDEPGTLLWQESTTDPGNATLHWVDPDRPGIDVRVATLDSFVIEAGIDAVDFLKIDVEGMERRVITGGLETLRKYRPVILFESSLCDEEQVEAARAIDEMLMGLGYRLHKILDERGTVRPTKFPDLSGNTVAVPEIGESPGTSGRS